MSCIDRVSIKEIELPDANARRPDEVMSDAPPLLRPGGPGSIDSHGFVVVVVEEGGEIDAIVVRLWFVKMERERKWNDVM